MQDDVYIISQDGWVANIELIPEHLIIARYYSVEKSAIEQLESSRVAIIASLEEMEEEHG